MPVEIDSIFRAKPYSTSGFLVTGGQGCYIPAYQRDYSWDNDNISRLFEDVLHGLNEIVDRPSTTRFIGTIIAIHDTAYRTVLPIYRPEVPPRVMTIIDGQQRIVTLAMMNIAIHDALRQHSARFRGRTQPHFAWIDTQSRRLLATLRSTFLIDNTTGTGNYRYYPRVIRAYDDAWSTKGGQARYHSPIARLIWKYIDLVAGRDDPLDAATIRLSQPFSVEPPDVDSAERHRRTCDAFAFVRNCVHRVVRNTWRDPSFPDLVASTRFSSSTSGIWNGLLDKTVSDFIAREGDHRDYRRFCEVLRLMMFARYLHERVALTVVETSTEDDAFDIFESLNTTGEPLTAYETLRPRVMEAEGASEYEHSPSRHSMIAVDEYLSSEAVGKTADDKRRATEKLIVTFALAETGERCSRRLRDQRHYLRTEFDACTGGGEVAAARQFLQSLCSTAQFMRYGWYGARDASDSARAFASCDHETLVALRALRDLKHEITVAPLSRFYAAVASSATGTEREQRLRDLAAAIRATAAFSMIWRGVKRGTAGIDSCYRTVMHGNQGSYESPGLARRAKGGGVANSLDQYRTALRHFLKQEMLNTKKRWVQKMGNATVYSQSKVVARFLLFCATDDAVIDRSERGLIARGRPGVAPLLSIDRWINSDYFTVEHIAPRSKSRRWDQGIYDADAEDTLGNLLLLPLDINRVLSDRVWKQKRAMYRLLAARTQEDFDLRQDELSSVLTADGARLGNRASQVLANARFLVMCEAVGRYGGEWRLTIVRRRTERLASLAWDRLWPWLAPNAD